MLEKWLDRKSDKNLNGLNLVSNGNGENCNLIYLVYILE